MSRRVQFTVPRDMDIQGGNHYSKLGGFSPVFIRVTQTCINPRWRSVRTSPSQVAIDRTAAFHEMQVGVLSL